MRIVCFILILIYSSACFCNENQSFEKLTIEFETAKALRKTNPSIAGIKFNNLLSIVNSKFSDSIEFKADIYYFLGRNAYSEAVNNDDSLRYKNSIDAFSNTIVLKKQQQVLDYKLSNSYNHLRGAYLALGEIRLAIEYCDSSLLFFKDEFDDENYGFRTNLLLNQGLLFRQVGDFKNAEIAYKKAERHIFSRSSESERYSFLWQESLNRLGLINYQQGNFEAAISYYESLDTTDFYIENFYNNWILCLEKTGELNKALRLNQKLEKEALTYELVDILPYVYHTYGWIYWSLGEFEKAKKALYQSKTYFTPTYQKAHFYDNLADIYLSTNQLDSALYNYNEALKLTIVNYKSIQLYDAPQINKATSFKADYLDIAESLASKANVLKQKHNQSKDLSALMASINHYLALDNFYNYIYAYVSSDQSKLLITADAKINYELAIKACYEMYQANEEIKWINQALHFIEKGKFVVLQQNLASLSYFSALPDSVTQKINLLKAEIRSSEDGITKSKKQVELNSIIKLIEKNYTSINNLKHQQDVLDIATIQNNILDKNQGIIEYFEGERFGYSIWITKNQTGFHQFNIDSTYTTSVKSFYQLISNAEASLKSIHDKGNELFKTLIPKDFWVHKLKRLLVFPDGQITLIPFGSLSKDNQFLIQQSDFGYAYSLNSYLYRSTKSNSKAITFSPNYSVSNQWQNLDYGKKSVSKISSIIQSKNFLNAKASKDAFIKASSNYGIIHLSMHGKVDYSNAWKSQLIFQPEGDDYQLNLEEIFGLGLNAKLIYLSACNTGTGQLVNGEGIMSFDWAFKSIGTESLITSRWLENDFASYSISTDFYKNLKKGLHKDVSISLAKKNYLEGAAKEGRIHPYYWAGSVCIGNLDSITIKNNYSNIWKRPLFILLTLLLTFVVVSKLRDTK